jgi:hypothetical protein
MPAATLNQFSGALPSGGGLIVDYCFRLMWLVLLVALSSSIFWLLTTFAVQTRASSVGARFKLLSV